MLKNTTPNNEVVNTDASSNITPMTVVPSVFMVVHDHDGVRGMMGGDNPVLAACLTQAADRFPDDVRRRDDLVFPLGQDIYDVGWEYMLTIRGCFTFLSAAELANFERTFPSSLRYSFVVTR